jgi:hypothetical protein
MSIQDTVPKGSAGHAFMLEIVSSGALHGLWLIELAILVGSAILSVTAGSDLVLRLEYHIVHVCYASNLAGITLWIHELCQYVILRNIGK